MRPTLLLASKSPQRRKLLKRLGRPFSAVAPGVGEDSAEKNPARLVVLLAKRKAVAVARHNPKSWVLGADTVVACRGRILQKPANRKDSERILRLLNGRWQKVYTGVALALEGGKILFTALAVTKVLARRLSKERLAALFGKHMDKAGAYAIQDRKDPFISRIVGDKDNVIGLPLRKVRGLLVRAAAS